MLQVLCLFKLCFCLFPGQFTVWQLGLELQILKGTHFKAILKGQLRDRSQTLVRGGLMQKGGPLKFLTLVRGDPEKKVPQIFY